MRAFGKLCQKLGCLEKFINIVYQFHDGMFAWVLDSGQCSHTFPATNGEELVCMLAPMLFSMMFSAMLSNVFNEDEHSIKVNYCTDGKFFNLKRITSQDQSGGSVGA